METTTCCTGGCPMMNIHWLWYFIAVILVYALGAFWYSKLFSKKWMETFKVEMGSGKPPMGGFIITMGGQLLACLILGLVIFFLSQFCACTAFMVLLAFCLWQMASLNFQFSTNRKAYWWAVLIEVGYLFLSGLIFILFARL